jgi:hypothetical protein
VRVFYQFTKLMEKHHNISAWSHHLRFFYLTFTPNCTTYYQGIYGARYIDKLIFEPFGYFPNRHFVHLHADAEEDVSCYRTRELA